MNGPLNINHRRHASSKYNNHCGVYAIVGPYGRCYVGASKYMEHRMCRHEQHLDRNTHWNPALQFDWLNYDHALFAFVSLECCSQKEMTKREQYWCDRLCAATDGYNYFPNVDSCLNRRWSPGMREKFQRRATEWKNKYWSNPANRLRQSKLLKKKWRDGTFIGSTKVPS
jgi:group I intron endonuclease